jgi:serine/threonine-protein kinase
VVERYRIIRALGRGGFGYTYLAEDTNRFNELCVLKECAPVTGDASALAKAKELFEREAGVLYQLQHPQIPRFREWFVDSDREFLFLVQDYVQGSTYQALLEARKRFNETDVVQLLLNVLPVLEYIHQRGVIHRDISPDNLILRDSDGLPVLIDFGGVKQVAVTIESHVSATAPITLIGKPGYAPDEQMRLGEVSPQSDLYALAVTALVLLIGKNPQEFLNQNTLTFRWRGEVSLNPALGSVLDRMIAPQPGDRYHSANEVLHALDSIQLSGTQSNQHSATQEISTQGTLVIEGAAAPAPPKIVAKARSGLRTFSQTLLILLACIGLASFGWWLGRQWLQAQPFSSSGSSEDPISGYPASEQSRKAALLARRQQLGIESGFFNQLVNEAFYAQHPDYQGRSLTSNPEDAELRTAWDDTAIRLLDALATVSSESRSRLGNYTRADLRAWESQLESADLSSKDFRDSVDAKFLQLFPIYQGKNLQGTPGGQLWYALAADQLKDLQSE